MSTQLSQPAMYTSDLHLSQDTQICVAFPLQQKYNYYILTCQTMPHLEEGQICTCLHFLQALHSRVGCICVYYIFDVQLVTSSKI